jgi:hypothetical protein
MKRPDRNPWWEGRAVVIRPDVPNVDVDSLSLVKTNKERRELSQRMSELALAEAQGSDNDGWPDWLESPPSYILEARAVKQNTPEV